MDSKAIETISTGHVRNSIEITGYLSQYIRDNDKEPVWDGNVYLYNNINRGKENLVGRVPVQVKGVNENDFTKDEITFDADVTDLRGYLADGGAIYFVVYFNDDNSKHKIYYTELSPVKLQILLNNSLNQKTKAIKLISFPDDNKEKANIFFASYKHFRMQGSFNNVELPTYENLDMSLVEKFTIPLVSVDMEYNPQELLMKTPTYIYANMKGNLIPTPMGVIMQNITTSEIVNDTISINGRKYYDNFERIRDKKGIKIKIGHSFEFEIRENDHEVHYKNSSFLKQRIIDLGFLLDVLKYKKIEINGKESPFVLDQNIINFDYEMSRKNLEYLQKVEKVFKELNYNEDIDISKFTTADWRNISYLIEALVDNKEVSNLNENIQSVGVLKISNIKFILTFNHVGNDNKTYKIQDFNASSFQVGYYNEDTKSYINTSKYCLLKCDDLVECKNIMFENILPSFTDLIVDKQIISQANALLLDLIKAYDLTRNKKILQTALDLSNWLLQEDCDEQLDNEIKNLNKLQVVKRFRDLNDSETKILTNIVDTSKESSNKAAACIILGKNDEATLYLEKLDEQERDAFKKFPIYSLMR